MKIIPAIDIIGGKCVRLTQGNYGQCKIYSANPLEMARLFEEAGLDRLHLVDLDGAKASGVVNWAVLETICKHTRLSVDFGGGASLRNSYLYTLQHGTHQVHQDSGS